MKGKFENITTVTCIKIISQYTFGHLFLPKEQKDVHEWTKIVSAD